MIPKKIILHHSLTEDSGTVSWGAIRKFHLTDPNYLYHDIGYHAGVELVKSGSELYYEVLMGRMWNDQGAHTRGHNARSLGLCFIGNFDIRRPPDTQLLAGARVVALWVRLFSIGVSEIYGHCDFAEKSCPGKMFDLAGFKVLVNDQLRQMGV